MPYSVLKDLDTFVFADTPIDQGQVRELATGTFLDAKRNAIFIGGTGTGKTHLCIAVASAGGADAEVANLLALYRMRDSFYSVPPTVGLVGDSLQPHSHAGERL